MNRKSTVPLSSAFIVLGVGLAFMSLGVFMPADGLIYKGLFSPMIMPILMGFIAFLLGIGMFVKYFEMKIKGKKTNWIGNKLIVQEEPQVAFIFVGSMIFIVSSLAIALGLFYPQEGFIYAGIYSEIIMALIIGSLFMVVSIVFLYFGIESIISKKIYNKLKNDGSMFTTTAKCYFEEFEKQNVIGEKQGFPYINVSDKVVYKYVDEKRVERISLSLDRYTEKQIEWFKNKNSISIRCLGKRSVLIDTPPIEKGE
jgi:hypothetical protein